MTRTDIQEPRPFLIGGRWRTGRGEPLATEDPARAEPIALVGSADRADVDDAVAAAQDALERPEWRDLRPHERARYLARFADVMETRKAALAELQMRDCGKNIRECRGLIASAVGTFRYYAAACETMEGRLTSPRGDSLSMLVHEPIGVVAAITPWNSPATLEAQKIAPVLASGSTIVLKPSEVTPLMGLAYAEIAGEVGLPAGALNVVAGRGDLVGAALVEHPGVRMVTFTGGTAVGRRIAECAARRLIPVSLELGGKSPNAVFADADLDLALPGVAEGIFHGCGQSCVAGSRIFVQRSIFEDFLRRLAALAERLRVGDPRDERAHLGSLASHAHRIRVESLVARAVEEGGRIVAGGGRPGEAALAAGAYYRPVVITGLGNDSLTAREEIFGPVALVLPFEDEEDLVGQANDSAFGLAAGIWTEDYRRAYRVARRLQVGTVWINTYKEMGISTPFGGMKDSGIGREKGLEGIRTYMQAKGVYWGLQEQASGWSR